MRWHASFSIYLMKSLAHYQLYIYEALLLVNLWSSEWDISLAKAFKTLLSQTLIIYIDHKRNQQFIYISWLNPKFSLVDKILVPIVENA